MLNIIKRIATEILKIISPNIGHTLHIVYSIECSKYEKGAKIINTGNEPKFLLCVMKQNCNPNVGIYKAGHKQQQVIIVFGTT